MLARLVAISVALVVPGVASAQEVYLPSAPTPGALFRDGATDRYLLGGTWLYRADPGDTGASAGFGNGAAATGGWSPVTVPNANNAGDNSTASMLGTVGWYRKDFLVPAGSAERSWIVRFESVNYRAQVWLNGRRIGGHVGGYLPFELDLSGVRRGGVNRLVVRVDNRRTPADLPPGGFYSGGTVPVGGWWNYGGILREVYLRSVVRADLSQVQVRPLLPCPSCAATIDERALVRNVTSRSQKVHLRGFYGGRSVDFGSATLAPRGTWAAHARVAIARPQLWSPGAPALYRATLTLSGARGERLAGYVTYSGIRSIIRTRDGHLLLNGRVLNLRGVGLHESDAVLGAALDSAHRQRLVSWVRQLGGTLIRAHYPLHPEIHELADRYGILLWSEVPVYQVASQYLTDPGWLAQAHALLQENILANQNHPSVLLWSVGNELASPAYWAESNYIAGAAALARGLDPTRPVGMAVSGWPSVGCQTAYHTLDVVGFNDYFGWYDVGDGGTADRDGLGAYLDEFRACYPDKALFVSEFGFEANRDGPVEERGTYGFQANSAAYHLSVFATKPWLSGAAYWALQDFVCRPAWSGGNPWPDPPFVHKGVVDLRGGLKPSFAAVAAAFGAVAQVGARAARGL
jgi:beta-glucuronidase